LEAVTDGNHKVVPQNSQVFGILLEKKKYCEDPFLGQDWSEEETIFTLNPTTDAATEEFYQVLNPNLSSDEDSSDAKEMVTEQTRTV